MDSSNHSTTTSLFSKISKLAPPLSKRALFFATYNRHQAWAFQKPIIEYIAKNPSSSKCYEKLIKSSKYFFVSNPILVVTKLSINNYKNEWHTYLNGNRVNLKDISSKLWVDNELYIGRVHGEQQYLGSSVLSKIYKIDAKIIHIYNLNILYHDLVFIALKCEEITLNTVKVMNNDNTAIALEKIIETLPNIRSILYDFDGIDPNIVTSDTVKELIKIPHFSNLTCFQLIDIPESFNLDDFYSYIKRNKLTKIQLHFYVPLLSDAYKQRLEEIINEIVQTEEHGYKVPFIYFPGIDESSYDKLWNLYDTN